MTGFTDGQIRAWEEQVAPTLKSHGLPSAAPFQIFGHWVVEWAEEIRPGRGQDFNGLYGDGEHFVQVLMDVYGRTSVSIATLDWIHADSDDELLCTDCRECASCMGRFGEHEDGCPDKPAPPHKHFMALEGRYEGRMVFVCVHPDSKMVDDECDYEVVCDLWK